jgi:hypothetical protein
MLNSNIEYDMNMTVIKIHKKKDEIKWLKLIEYKEDYISIGSILEIPNLYDFENRTQVIVFDSLRDNCGLALLVVSGIKAGSIYVIFPEESKYKNTRMMSKKWLLDNFYKWISPNSNIKETLFLFNLYL